jgi:hypothetical protein
MACVGLVTEILGKPDLSHNTWRLTEEEIKHQQRLSAEATNETQPK